VKGVWYEIIEEKGFPPVHIALEREMLHLSLSKFVF
jgi:hypothetical protein